MPTPDAGTPAPDAPQKKDLESIMNELADSKLLNLEASVRDTLPSDFLRSASDDDGVLVVNNNYFLVVKPIPPLK
ncbi:hypothetical protein GCM10010222_49420 [Streptomyces tanashiensis]|uniref:hypothetical protein n=1 Tax=Streptomyces tanashiensis TaxID=67367 RepID=UPI0016749553|nr:hypothetical protein [Streptomyces tanashiensis]GGT01837.1 hypothetical protein GCM10010222_49420 [Streptomyces tanashiensis]